MHRAGLPFAFLAAAAFASGAPTPVLAQTAAFDGTYVGVSARTINDGGRLGCPADAPATFVPHPLTIAQGRVQGQWRSDSNGPIQGTVAPDGSVNWRTNFQGFSGRIANGVLTGRVTWRNGCNYEPVVWRKR